MSVEGIPQEQLDDLLNIGEHPEAQPNDTSKTSSSGVFSSWLFYFGIGAVALLAFYFFMLRTRPK